MSTAHTSLLNKRDGNLLINGYSRSVQWIIPVSVHRLIVAYCPHKFNIYAIGSNANGEFATGSNEPLKQYTKLDAFELIVDDYKDIYYGRCRFIVKNVYNHVFSVGSNHFGVNGSNSKRKYIPNLSMLLHKEGHIRLISQGLTSNHSFAVTCTNEIYAFGINDYYQWGNGQASNYANRAPTLLNSLSAQFKNHKIIKICTGLNHSLFLTHNGKVFACGKNTLRQCGIKKTIDNLIKKPIIVPGLEEIADIDCGYMHNLCVDSNGKLLVFGYNRWGQLSIDRKRTILPQQNNFFENMKIVKISCGKSHSFAIDDTGKCWLFGNNSHGQIATPEALENGTNAREPHLFQKCGIWEDDLKDAIVVDGACGYNHTVLLTKNQEVYAFGDNKWNAFSSKLSTDDNYGISITYQLTRKEMCVKDSEEIVRIIAGRGTTLLVTQ